MYKMLVKANDDVISFCKCEEAIAISGQADCPWCGCGWLFSCMNCGKAFTFAKIVETELSPLELSKRDYARLNTPLTDLKEGELENDAEWFAQASAFPIGEVCVVLDGKVLPAHQKDVTFSGWYAKHSLREMPQTQALRDKSVLGETIGSVDYWFDRETDEHLNG